MGDFLRSPVRAAAVGAGLTALVLVMWLAAGHPDGLGAVAFVTRYLHAVAAMIWVGLIFFTNFIHIPAIDKASDPERKIIAAAYAPRLGTAIRHVARTTMATGILMLVLSGYVGGRLVYGTDVYLPAMRTGPLWLAAFAGILMWAFVEFGIAPSLARILDPSVPPEAKVGLRQTVKTYARLNLVLMLPVAFAMLLAAHL